MTCGKRFIFEERERGGEGREEDWGDAKRGGGRRGDEVERKENGRGKVRGERTKDERQYMGWMEGKREGS